MAYINRMKGQDYIDKSIEYLDYIEEHLENVKRAFCELSKICEGMWWVGDDKMWHTLRQEIIHHDLSKFSREEFVQYRDSFYPVDPSDKTNSKMEEAWEHHKLKNSHHHGTVKDYSDVVHMIIDWTAMGYKFGDSAQGYYETNKDKICLSDDHKKFMYEIFDRIKAI
ncbi:MAG: hypothetical protein GY866_03115 [Proteobacteria bacterium]|nr:hypothetical protein [Pseudomonadota bacterium]